MSRKLIACLIITAVSGCTNDLEYKWDTKYIVEGRVTNSAGQPLTGITVSMHVSTDGGTPGPWGSAASDSQIISSTSTDENGKYTLLFPTPENADDMELLINTTEDGTTLLPAYSHIVKYHILIDNFINYKLDFGTQQLFNPAESTTLTVEYVDVESIATNLGSVNFEELVNPGYHDVNFGVYTPGSPYGNGNILQVSKNQIVTLKYQKLISESDGSYTVVPVQIPIPINDVPVNFILEY